MADYTIYQGHVMDILAGLPDGSVNCCVTSPPYWGLRDYKLEPQVWGGNLECSHTWNMETFKPQSGGTGPLSAKQVTNKGTQGSVQAMQKRGTCEDCGAWMGHLGLESSPYLYIEHLVAVFQSVRRAMSNDATLWLNIGDTYAANRGYQVPSTKGGSKHSPAQGFGDSGMTVPKGLKAKDLVGIPWRLALALQADGWWLRSDVIWHKPNVMPSSVRDRPTTAHEYMFMLSKSATYYYDADSIAEQSTNAGMVVSLGKRSFARRQAIGSGSKPSGNAHSETYTIKDTRNKRSVWSINTSPYAGAHFATFPPALVEPCILAGCPIDGMVLDPFCGSGTTGMVAMQHGRNFIGVELNGEYCKMAEDRIYRGLMK